MNHLFHLLCTFSIVLIPFHYTLTLNAASSFEQEASLINSYEEDVTGDGFREYLRLHGNLLSTQSIFFPDVWLDITNPFSQHWKISLQAGYDPDIRFIDLTNDHIFDIFYTVAKDVEKQNYEYQLYSLKNGTVERIQLPKHDYIKTALMNNFKLKIQIDPHEKPIIHSIVEKEHYLEDDIYQKDGKLLATDKKLLPKSIHFIDPILISETNGYGLKTHQQIKGLYNEVIGEVQTLWYFKNAEWILLKTDWIPH